MNRSSSSVAVGNALVAAWLVGVTPARAEPNGAPAPRCPPGSWFCEDASLPRTDPGAPTRASGPLPATAPPPGSYGLPEPSDQEQSVALIEPDMGAPPLYEAPPPPPPPRARSRWAAAFRIEGVTMGNSHDRSPDASMSGAGFSLRTRPMPHFAIDFGADAFGGHDFYGRSRSEFSLTVNPMFFVNPRNALQLYFLAGVGASTASVDQTSTYNYIGIDAGVGVECASRPQIAIDFDWVGFVRGRTDGDRNNPEFVDPTPAARPTRPAERCFGSAWPTIGEAVSALLNQIFEGLERRGADLLRGRLALDGDRLLGEGIDAGAIFGRRLLDRLELEKAGDHELAGTARAELLLDDLGEPVEHAIDALLVELGQLRELGNNLRLGQPFASHLRFLLVCIIGDARVRRTDR